MSNTLFIRYGIHVLRSSNLAYHKTHRSIHVPLHSNSTYSCTSLLTHFQSHFTLTTLCTTPPTQITPTLTFLLDFSTMFLVRSLSFCLSLSERASLSSRSRLRSSSALQEQCQLRNNAMVIFQGFSQLAGTLYP